ncbi:cysteine proteinase inhibitor 5-like [Sesamum indicum]|uniref:Cysteine proteinase inhibitor 5-like n=1 Tax=Sesamum indicum TaxID=4182 RepID=A0A6I9U5I9_SESIN|nr:cysteine proteinase inhibitor 5-like [Sesamum indicum]
MARESGSLLFVFLAILLASALNEASNVGGWQPINPKDPQVVDIANFAVTEHNKEAGSALVFQDVVKGQKQVVAGINYQLVIAAGDGTPAGVRLYYQAIVWEQASQKSRKLLSFQQIRG